MSWIYLILAIILEVSGTTSMKVSNGFSKLIPSLFVFIFYLMSITSLTIALKAIDVSIAYAIWSGLGTALITIIGMIYFNETISAVRIFSILLIIIGVVSLNLTIKTH